MIIDDKTYQRMPPDLQSMFKRNPNPGSDEVVGLFPVTTSGKQLATHKRSKQRLGASGIYGASADPADDPLTETYGDSGSAARFFYCAKASKSERNAGCKHLLWDTSCKTHRQVEQTEWETLDPKKRSVGNIHATVKPLALMQYLLRLVTPPGGIVLDPFCGSGTTLVAAQNEGFRAIGIELNSDYCEIIKQRLRQGVLEFTG